MRARCVALFALLSGLSALGIPPRARADSAVASLGVRSLDGDDALAKDVSKALREGARRITGWQVSAQEVSLEQMILAQGCEEPDARCLAGIANVLSVGRLVYGTIARRDQVIHIELFHFDAVTGQVVATASDEVALQGVEGAALGPLMLRMTRRLGGVDEVGTIRVSGLPAGAQVLLDGQAAGRLDGRGELILGSVPVGDHTVTLRQEDHVAQEAVTLQADQVVTLRMSAVPARHEAPAPTPAAPPENGSNVRRIVGYSLLGLAGAFGISAGYSWLRLDDINDDADLKAYRALYPPPGSPGGTNNVCNKAEQHSVEHTLDSGAPTYEALVELEGSARSLCSEASTLRLLGVVFLGAAVVAGGTGLYMLLTQKEPDVDPARVSLHPSWSRHSASLRARLSF